MPIPEGTGGLAVNDVAVCDLGNSRLKWGVGRRAAGAAFWRAQGAIGYDELGTLAARLAGSGAGAEVLFASVTTGERERAFEAALAAAGLQARRFVSTASAAGVRNGYAQAAQLGADRWAALIGAWARLAGPVLVVSAGTATTIDVLLAEAGGGCFRGGVILPGLSLMRDSLARAAARLPQAQGSFVDFPANTDDAIATGVVHAQLGAIERMRRLLPTGAPCLLTGGAAPALADGIAAPCTQVPWLVLEGLLAAAEGA
jgi:type III pantothenate kinase